MDRLSPLAAAMRRRRVPRLLAVLAGIGTLALPQHAAAQALAGPESVPGLTGLPDGRVYEQVSPANKSGNEAASPVGFEPPYIVAGVQGNETAYFKEGPFGSTTNGFEFYSVSRRTATGWQTRGAVPRGEGTQEPFVTNPQNGLYFSAEMTASAFGAEDSYTPEQPVSSPTPHLYRYGDDGLVQWIGKPAIAEPVTVEKYPGGDLTGRLIGGSPDFQTIYFYFEGALAPEDEQPNPALGGISRMQIIHTLNEETGAAHDEGLYEWHEGTLRSAAALPNGHLDPHGAQAASLNEAFESSPAIVPNDVSRDGNKMFFVSPDPQSQAKRPVELYMHLRRPDGTTAGVLVSRDLLLPEEEGFPVKAPDGVRGGIGGSGVFYVYASPDGSHAFFQSTDRLTAGAPEDESVKVYDFDTDTEELTYLPIGASAIFASAADGSSFLFVSDKTSNEPVLEVWSEGTVREIAHIAEGSLFTARSDARGAAYVFQARTPFSGYNFNNGGGNSEVYRYDVAANTLSCISCAPSGTPDIGETWLSHAYGKGSNGNTIGGVYPGNRAVTEDGNRIFFDTPNALVPQDTNGVRDAYEWEDGALRLISTGVGQEDSFFGDNSPTGGDVFFSTSEGIAPGDTDRGYDVYDARIPRPGDQLPPSAVPCEGAVCQGPPSVPQLFSAPASETFDGAGDAIASPATKPAAKSLSRKQKLARALKQCKRYHGKHRRATCERKARKRFGAHAASERPVYSNGHRIGRGK